MKRRKNAWTLMAVVMAMSVILTSGLLPTKASDLEKDYDVTLGELQETFDEYLMEEGYDFSEGTDEYYEYINEQLLYHTDERLRQHPSYDLLHAFMVEYKVAYADFLLCQEVLEYSETEELAEVFTDAVSKSNDCIVVNSSQDTVEFCLSESFQSKTINDIIQENAESNSSMSFNSNKVSGYNASDAVSYAKKYATSYNTSEYPKYSGEDCTNFVSQCLYAGGISMKGTNSTAGIYDSTTKWYCRYIKTVLLVRKYAVSTSWIRVSDFNTYMKSLVSTSKKTTISSLVSSCAVGDVVQLADKTTGTPYHTIIISSKSSSSSTVQTAGYCGHSSDRNDVDVHDYLDESSDCFILFDFT